MDNKPTYKELENRLQAMEQSIFHRKKIEGENKLQKSHTELFELNKQLEKAMFVSSQATADAEIKNYQLELEIQQGIHSENINKALFEISNAVNTTDNLEDLYKSIYDSLNHIIKLPNFFIAIVDAEQKLLNFPFFVDEHDTQQTITMGLEKYEESTSNTSRVISTKKPLFLKKDILQTRFKQKKTIGTVSVIWIGVPLIVRDEVIGVMVLQHYSEPEYFTQKDLNLLIAVSDQVALAIDRKKSQEEIKQKEKITRTLFSISNAVNTTLNLHDLYKQIHSLLGDIIDVTNFFIAILNNKERTLYFPYHADTVDEDFSPITNFNPKDSLTGLVVSKRTPILLTKDELKDLSNKKEVWGPVSKIWLGVPLMIKDEVIGVIAVQSYTDPHLYKKHDLELLTSISDQVAIAIDRKRTEDELRESEKKYRHLFNNAPTGMYEIDFIKQKFIEVNDVLCKQTGYSEDDFLSIKPLDLLTGKSTKQFIEDYETVLNGGKISKDVEYNIIKKNGQILSAILKNDYIFKEGKLVGARVVVHDFTKRKAIENNLKRLASTDPLTGTNNRRSFLDKGADELLRSRRYNHSFSFLMMDIDHFKAVNDTFGHQVGDEVLKELVSRSNKIIRTTDTFGRLGGEEFAVILPETDTEAAMELAERLRIELSRILVDSDLGQVQFTVSIGLSMLEKKVDTLATIMGRADSALYKAKKDGRNRLVKF